MTLSAPYRLEYAYTRSVGATLGAFLAGLRQGRILGAKVPSGAVVCPPTEYDPYTGEALQELVEVGPAGTVNYWTWVAEPRPTQPLDRPFAFALIRLDGASTAMLHAVDAGSEDAMSRGMRVAPRFATARRGSIADIACFVPGEDPEVPALEPEDGEDPDAPVGRIVTPIGLDYSIAAGREQSVFLSALCERRILGSVDPDTGEVYVPMRRASPITGTPFEATVELAHTGTVTTFCVVRIPFEGQRIKPPYVCAQVILDGADTPLFHLVGGCSVDAVHSGMRVRAEWVDDADLAPTLESIKWFAPIEVTDG